MLAAGNVLRDTTIVQGSMRLSEDDESRAIWRGIGKHQCNVDSS